MADQNQADAGTAALKRTALHVWHLEKGAKMVPFAGYEMPVQYADGVLKEHQHTRAAAGLFDVSHMGQAFVLANSHEAAAQALERIVPGDISGLAPGRMRYTVLLNDSGGIVDDLMVTRSSDSADDGKLLLVLNASRKEVDLSYIASRLPAGVTVAPVRDRSLIALQGPEAANVLGRHCPDAANLSFMTSVTTTFDDVTCQVSRSGYTGEDGYEISLSDADVAAVAAALDGEGEVAPVGLGARDSLRLEAGLCLYGHDIDETTSPVEAGLTWVVAKKRREAGGFAGSERVVQEIADGPPRRRVGLKPSGRAPAREGTVVTDLEGEEIGHVTSGGFGPTADGPVAMGYVRADSAETGTKVQLIVRGKPRDAEIAALPFVPHRYATGKA